MRMRAGMIVAARGGAVRIWIPWWVVRLGVGRLTGRGLGSEAF